METTEFATWFLSSWAAWITWSFIIAVCRADYGEKRRREERFKIGCISGVPATSSQTKVEIGSAVNYISLAASCISVKIFVAYYT